MIQIPLDRFPSIESLYQTILSQKPLPLPGFEKIISDQAHNRAQRIHDYLVERLDRREEDCILCFDRKARHTQTRWVYETPRDEEDTQKPF